jgi:type IV secretion system protein VirB9
MFLVRSLSALAAAAVMTVGGAGFAASAASSDKAILPDGSVRYAYGRRPMPELICKPQYVCDIELDSGESVLNMAIGDASRWVIAGGKSGPGGTTPHIFVKPTQPDLETNLIVTTTKRLYDITLRSAKDAQHPHISFAYVDDEAAAKAAIADHERASIENILNAQPAVGMDRVDTKYKVTGEPTLIPDKVFNDGSRTFIQWKSLPLELPQVFSIATNGATRPENFRVVGSTYVIDNIDPDIDLVLAATTERHALVEHRASIRHL